MANVITGSGVMKQSKKAAKGGKKSAVSVATPIFLRKTYEMIDVCDREDASIACWADNGTSFVVKDKHRFENEVIPQYFNHNKLSSFVRQLNMYGFRKVKFDSIRLKDARESSESNYCKFAHPFFQKGRQDLVAKISKSSPNDSAEKEEIESLRSEVKSLKKRLGSAEDDIAELKALVRTLVKNQSLQAQDLQAQSVCYPEEIASKKRKIEEQTPMPILSEQSPALTALPETPGEGNLEYLGDKDATGCSDGVPAVPAIKPLRDERVESTSTPSFDLLDQEDIESLIKLDADDEISLLDNVALPDGIFSSNETNNINVSKPADSTVDPECVEKLRMALSNLPIQMQQMFVDRIVEAIGDPEKMKQQVDAMTSLALSAAEEAQRRLALAGRAPNDALCIPLASAVLGAYLAHYNAAGVQMNAVDTPPL